MSKLSQSDQLDVDVGESSSEKFSARWGASAVALVLLLFLALPSFAGTSFVYEGTLQTAEGEAVKTGGRVRIDVVSPTDETCVLYSEEHDVAGNDQGYFSIEVGKTPRALTPPRTLDAALSNKLPNVCDGGGAFSPAADAQRKIVVQITPAGGSLVKFPAQVLAASPYASQAANVGGFAESNLMRVVNGTVPATAPTFTAAQASTLVDVASGKLAGIQLPTLIGTNKTLRYNGTSWEEFVAVETETDPLVKTFAKTDLPTCAAGEVLTGDGTTLNCVAVGANSISSGTIGGTTIINTSGNVSAGTVSAVTLTAGGVTGGTISATLVSSGSFTGGNVSVGTVASSLVSSTSFTGGTVSVGTVTSNRVSAGTLTTTLVNSDSFAGGTVSVGTVTTTSLTASSVSLGTATANALTSGAVSLNSLYVWNTSNARAAISAPASFTNYDLTLPTTDGNSGQMLVTDGSGVLSWDTPADGSVKSVGLSLPSLFSVSGGPVTTTGTLSATLSNQAANSVFAGPSSGGSAGTPSFRSLVAADIPALDAAKITSGTLGVSVVSDNLVAARHLVALDTSLTAGVILTSPTTVGTNMWMVLPSTAGSSGQVLQTDGVNPATLSWRSVYGDGSTVRAADGTAAAPGISFSNDTNTGFYRSATDNLSITTAGTQRLTISELGNLAIGADPDNKRVHIATSGASGEADDFVIDAYNNNNSAAAIMSRRAKIDANNLLVAPGDDEAIAKITSSVYKGTDGLPTWTNWIDSGSMQIRTETVSSGTVSTYMKFELLKNNQMSERLRIDSSGNVGVGTTSPMVKLDVNGRMKLASDTSTGTCGPSSAGSQRYNSSTKSMEFCNGSAWIRLALGGCPAGWKHITKDNQQGYCIQLSQSALKVNETDARTACRDLDTGGWGRAHLCTWDQWQVACYDGGLSDIGPNAAAPGVATSEWISEIATSGAYVVDNTLLVDCSTRAGSNYLSTFHNYRCCISP